MRIAAVVLVVALAALPACKSSSGAGAPQGEQKASTYDGEGAPKIKFGDKPSSSSSGGGGSGGPGVVDYVAVPFENVVYLPWKLIGGGFKGAADGVGAGFAKDRMPFFGALFSPVNAVAGFLTGAVEGAAGSPGVVGPSDDFGWAMSRPTKHATSIWWYE